MVNMTNNKLKIYIHMTYNWRKSLQHCFHHSLTLQLQNVINIPISFICIHNFYISLFLILGTYICEVSTNPALIQEHRYFASFKKRFLKKYEVLRLLNS